VKAIGVTAGVVAVLVVPWLLQAQGQKVVDKDGLVERDSLFYEQTSETPFTGTTVSYHPNGQIKTEGEFRDGKRNGIFTLWFQDGLKQLEEEYWDGREEWRLTQWYRNGQKCSEGMLKKGQSTCQGELQSIAVGLWTYWYQNGQKKRDSEYQDGIEISRVEWDEYGNLIRYCPPLKTVQPRALLTKDGLKYERDTNELFSGLVAAYWENGHKWHEKEYRAGKLHGKAFTWYGENGQRQSEIEYRDGVEISRIEWDTNGNLIQQPQPQPSPNPIR